MVRGFQNMTQAIKFCPRPVVVAPYGMCLGGGVEIAIHAAARQAHAELYLGLVETGVGLDSGRRRMQGVDDRRRLRRGTAFGPMGAARVSRRSRR